jgi:hypothetical protein
MIAEPAGSNKLEEIHNRTIQGMHRVYNNPVVFDCLENHKTGKKSVLGTKCKFFLHSSCFKYFLLQSIFTTSHLMSPGIHVVSVYQ